MEKTSLNKSRPPRPAKKGKVWMKVLVGIRNFFWVERNAGGPDDVSSTKSMEKAKNECVVRTTIDMSNEDPFQQAFENKMPHIANGGMSKRQKGGYGKREYLPIKKKH